MVARKVSSCACAVARVSFTLMSAATAVPCASEARRRAASASRHWTKAITASASARTKPAVTATSRVRWRAVSALRLARMYCVCNCVGSGCLPMLAASHASASSRSVPRRIKLLSRWRFSHSSARTSRRVWLRTWSRSVSSASFSALNARMKSSLSRKNSQLCEARSGCSSVRSSTSRRRIGTSFLLCLTACSISRRQISETAESGLMTNTNALAFSMPA